MLPAPLVPKLILVFFRSPQEEEELGVTLFHRSKRRVELTDAGQVFLEEARRTLVQAEHACRMAQRAQRSEIGRLMIGFVSEATYDLLQAYRARFPRSKSSCVR